jgi:hypothetical protein
VCFVTDRRGFIDGFPFGENAMLMARSRDGSAAEFVGRPKITDRGVMLARSLSIVRMRERGYTFAAIGKFHGITRQRAWVLYFEVPEHVRNRSIEVLDHADVG